MFSERLQILVTSTQRRRLETEARERGASVGGLIREAIDTHFGGVSREAQLRALARIEAMEGRFLPPDELDRIADEQRTARLLRDLPR